MPNTKRIGDLNDHFRRNPTAHGRVMPTRAVNAMGWAFVRNVTKKAVKASKPPVDDLEALLRTAALRRLQGSTTAGPNEKRASGKAKKR